MDAKKPNSLKSKIMEEMNSVDLKKDRVRSPQR